ncbi:ferritin-like domain-containing protein [Xylogone sp. PMI_703]|nr:ferritin-like domain-containing protein [Xylogone sp. PMI_703]
MHSINTLLCLSSIALGSFAAAAPLCSNTTDVAGGGLPNIDKPPLISPNAIKGVQLALFLENLEVSYFSTGLTNITKWGTSGYANDTIDIVSKVVTQEEVHVATFVDLLQAYDAALIPACNYSFPVNSTEQFFELADIITSVGIGAAIGLAESLAVTDPELVKSVSSILTVESRHDAFFRHIVGEVPNPSPFDTGISDIWAYNLAHSFIVPGSCSIEVPLPILPTLTVSDASCSIPTNSTGNELLREFTWDPTQMTFVAEAGKQLLVGWVNQLNVPLYTPLNITVKGKGTAPVPQGMNGVAFAAVTTQEPDNTNDLALATLAGPVALVLS